MTEINLIRHGETDWNVEEIFRGQADIQLNEIGTKQAQLVSSYLRNTPIEAVYSSPLKRALKTAEMIADPHNIDVMASNELIDLDYGEWQGLPHEVVKNKYETLYQEWMKTPHLVRIPKGESLGDIRKRAVSLIEQVVAEHEGSTVALVSHRVILKVLICALLGLDNSHFWNIKVDTCGITTFIYQDNSFVIEKLNDTSFLKSIDRPPLSDF